MPSFAFTTLVPIVALYQGDNLDMVWAKGMHSDGGYFYFVVISKDGAYLVVIKFN